MKSTIYKALSFSAFIFLALTSIASGQITSSTSSRENITPAVLRAQDAVNKVLVDSGSYFKEGMSALKENRRSDSGANFDKSVEIFLYSTLNIQKDQKLQTCYSQLIETVYRIEFPSDAQQPKIRELSASCGWRWSDMDFQLADDVAKLVKQPLSKPTANNTVAAAGVSVLPQQTLVGFNAQEFEPSPLDELSRLELTPEEKQIENSPVAQAQYQYIQYAVANKSLGFSFQVHPMIQQYINYYRGRGRGTMEVGLYRSGMFMRMARRIFKEEGIPENVAWLGQVESAWKPTAMSWAAASGLWQFIPGTGAAYGLRRTAHLDERNSFDEATRASARYLKFLANRYGGNWELAMAGYNCGEGNVDRAIRRAGVANFWAAYPYLPRETRNYVPNILATILIANSPAQYGFGHVRPAPPLQYDRIRVPASTNLALIAQASDTSVQYIRYLNPHLRSNSTPPEPYVINVPPGKSDDVVAVFRRVPASKLNNTNLANSVKGESWQTISNRTGVGVAELIAANPGMKEPKGKIFVPVTGNKVNAISYSRPTTPNTAGTGKSAVVVKAQAGDTVSKVAARHGANPTEVAKYNGLLPNSVLGAGREIKIPSM
ncbi:MAG: transglycosylase SLT domain-containing protein [Acidobacteriota bacterium]|nr:transglycosylase SLT domain-containing protein [Blastocatellia bacterium]MDQ3490469.1 transglycosylase SLT domain-containing protein [Acidobacteriota bacterium]